MSAHNLMTIIKRTSLNVYEADIFNCSRHNLPAGLLAGSVVSASHVPQQLASAVLIGVDLGPNLSVTGSLATFLWLSALRRENQEVSAWSFLKLGALAAAGFAGRNWGLAGHRFPIAGL